MTGGGGTCEDFLYLSVRSSSDDEAEWLLDLDLLLSR